MKEKKHVELQTLFQEKKPDYTKCPKTIEIVVDIMESSSECYTEIDYELELEEKKRNSKSIEKRHHAILDGLNFDNDNDLDVRDTAAEFEAKYGRTEENYNPKHNERDFGGYESDSFIDNSEAFDEGIPHDIVPLYGGCYINVGSLEYVKEEQEHDKAYTRVGKYRSLSIPKVQLLKELNQKIFTLKKGKLHTENKKLLVRKSKIEKRKEGKKETKFTQPQSGFLLNPFKNFGQILKNENEGSDQSQKEISCSDSDRHNLLQNEVKLPTKCPSDVVKIVEKIKNFVSLQDKRKNKTFINNLLLKLEYKCKHLKNSMRIKVYDHLAPFVKCKRKSLTKRAKHLYVTEEYKRANEVLEKLKIAVIARMTCLQNERENEASILFVWNDETKELLKDVINLQRNCFKLDRKRNDPIATRLSEFVKANLLPIWPEGCMSASGLLDYCDSVSKEVEKLSAIMDQYSSDSDSPDYIAPLQGDSSSTENYFG